MAFLLKHLTTVHSGRPGFFFSCGLNGCQRTFRNITTYKHHVYAIHSKHHTNLPSADPGQLEGNDEDDNESVQREDEIDIGCMEDSVHDLYHDVQEQEQAGKIK